MTVTAEQQQRAAAAGGEGKQQKHALPCRASRDAAAGGRRGLERPGKPRAKARRKLRPRNFRNLLGEASSRRACKVHGSASPRRASLADVAGSERRDKVFSLLSGVVVVVVAKVAKVAACRDGPTQQTAGGRYERLPTVLLPAAGAGWYSEDGHERIRHS